MLTATQSAWVMLLILVTSAAGNAAALAKTDRQALLRRHRPTMMRLMHRTMGTVLVFLAVPKLLNPAAFAATFRKYDLVAGAFPPYAYAYPLLELGLGVAWWRTDTPSTLRSVYVATIIVLGATFVGVLYALAAGRQLECGCLNSLLRMPLTHVTLVETGAMVAMAAYLLARRKRVRFKLPA